MKEMPDRVVVTWDLTEPLGGIQDFTWVKTVNRFQAVLRRDGTIEMSYDQVSAKDAIVGLYPTVAAGAERALATLAGEKNPSVAPHLNIQSIKVAVIDNLFLKVTLETRGSILPQGDSSLAGITYPVSFDTHKTSPTRQASTQADVIWTIPGVGAQGRGGRGGGASRYFPRGPSVSSEVKINRNSISMQGTLSAELKGVDHLAIYAEVIAPGSPAAVDRVPSRTVTLSGIRSPEVDLSSLTRQDGPFAIVYESFHYLALPNPRDLTCTVIKTLGDKFDFLAYYSDFRVDNQEAGTPSTGPLGGNVTGIGTAHV